MSIPELKLKTLPELLKLVHDHESNAFNYLVREQIKSKLYGFVHSQARCHEDEEDICVEAQVRLQRALLQYIIKEEGGFYKLLFTIVKNAAIDFYKRAHDEVHNEEILYDTAGDEPDEFEQLSQPEQDALHHRILMKAVKELSPQQQMVVLFRAIDEMTNEQIGALLHMRPKDVGTVYSQATARLKEIIERYKKEAKEKEQKIFSTVH